MIRLKALLPDRNPF